MQCQKISNNIFFLYFGDWYCSQESCVQQLKLTSNQLSLVPDTCVYICKFKVDTWRLLSYWCIFNLC